MIALILAVLVGIMVLGYVMRWFFKINILLGEVKAIQEETKMTAQHLSAILAEMKTYNEQLHMAQFKAER